MVLAFNRTRHFRHHHVLGLPCVIRAGGMSAPPSPRYHASVTMQVAASHTARPLAGMPAEAFARRVALLLPNQHPEPTAALRRPQLQQLRPFPVRSASPVRLEPTHQNPAAVLHITHAQATHPCARGSPRWSPPGDSLVHGHPGATPLAQLLCPHSVLAPTLEHAAVLDGPPGNLLHLGVVLDVDLLGAVAQVARHRLHSVQRQLLRTDKRRKGINDQVFISFIMLIVNIIMTYVAVCTASSASSCAAQATSIHVVTHLLQAGNEICARQQMTG